MNRAGLLMGGLRMGGLRMGGLRIAGEAVAIRAAAARLGAGCIVWAAAPQVHKGAADFALFLAILGVAAGCCGSR